MVTGHVKEADNGPAKPTPSISQESVGTLPPAPAVGLTGGDLARLRQALDSSVSDNTKAMYNSAWRSFQDWAQARGTLTIPASPPLVAAYLAHLAEERRLSVATVRLHKAALAAVHKAAGLADPTDNEPVRQIMKGLARAHGRPQKQARPLTAEAQAAVRPPLELPGLLVATARAENQPNGPVGGPGWTWPCWPP